MHIRNFIALMVAAVTLPLVVASAFAVNNIRVKEKATAVAVLHKTVDAAALLVDRDIAGSLAALHALGNSPHLVSGNFAAFYAQAQASNRTANNWIALVKPDGTVVLNTAVPFGVIYGSAMGGGVPSFSATIARVHASQKPWVSDVFSGARSARQLIAVYSPAPVAGAEGYVIAQGFALDYWKSFQKKLDLPADWIVAVIDRAGLFIARSHKSDEFLGKPARAELVAAAAGKPDGLIRLSTLDKVDSYQAFDHSELTGWTIAVAAPVDSVDAAADRAVLIALGGFLLAMLVSGVMAAAFGRRFIAAVDTARSAAVALGQGKTPTTKPTAIAEVNSLNQSLTDAGQLLDGERQARLAAERERERLLEVERLARDAAQKENTAKDHFLAMLGHELRNPLAAISGAVAVLTRGARTGRDTDRYLGIINRQNRHLVHIIDDLLDMSRLIAGKIVLERHAVDLAECLKNCVDGLRAAERVRQHTIEVTAQPVWVNADPVRMEQIIINLIGNALKFSASGTLIEVALHPADGFAVMTVKDHGSGISPELLARVFEPFVQGPTPVNGTQSGMGIGLALVKQLVELHGGSVRVASRGAGQGSTFTLQFPTVTAPASKRISGFGQLTAACPRTLLYVEDNDDARAVMSEMLRLSGYEVVEAPSGTEALAALAVQRPDAILLDIGLPDMNGYELTLQIQQHANGRGVPIIALTGYGQTRDKDTAVQVGFSAHLVKPVDPEELTRTIEAMLGSPAQHSSP